MRRNVVLGLGLAIPVAVHALARAVGIGPGGLEHELKCWAVVSWMVALNLLYFILCMRHCDIPETDFECHNRCARNYLIVAFLIGLFLWRCLGHWHGN